MSDLSELRERLHLDLERVIGAAAIVELDADAMRSAILDALSIYESALGGQKYGAEVDERDAQAMASAAARMAARLRLLHSAAVNAAIVPEVEPPGTDAQFCDECKGPYGGWLAEYGGHWDTCPNRTQRRPGGGE